MPRKARKSAKSGSAQKRSSLPTVSEEERLEAKRRYESFRGDMEGWRALSGREQNRFIRLAMSDNEPMACLICGDEKGSAPGLSYHIDHCKGSSSTLDPDAIRNPIAFYESFRQRLPDWRQLMAKQQSWILRKVFEEFKKLECLECSTVLTTQPGMIYHLRNCNLRDDELPVQCPKCSAKVERDYFEAHFTERHTSVQPDSRRKSAVRASETIGALAESLGERALKADFSNATEDEEDVVSEVSRLLVPEPHVVFRKSGLSRSYSPKKSGLSRKPLKGHRMYISHSHQKFTELSDGFKNFFPDWVCKVEEWGPNSECDDEALPPFENSMRLSDSSDATAEVLGRFQSRAMAEGLAGFCGGPVSALAWCPLPSSHRHTQFLLISTFADENLGLKSWGLDLVQVWKIVLSEEGETECGLALGLLHPFGTVTDFTWCPFGIWTPPEERPSSGLRRLGAFCAATASGSLPIFCVPNLDDLPCPSGLCFCSPPPVNSINMACEGLVTSVQWEPCLPLPRRILLVSVQEAHGRVLMWDVEQDRTTTLFDGEESGEEPRAGVWLSPNTVLVTLSSREVGVVETESGEWLYRAPLFGHTSLKARPLPACFPGALLWADHPWGRNGWTFAPYFSEWDGKDKTMTAYRTPNRHVGTLWDAAFSPWTGQLASVCNSGKVIVRPLSFSDELDSADQSSFDSIEVVLVGEAGEERPAYNYEECLGPQQLRLQRATGTRQNATECARAFGAEECSGVFPICALFHAQWSPNPVSSHCLAVAGQAGFIFLLRL